MKFRNLTILILGLVFLQNIAFAEISSTKAQLLFDEAADLYTNEDYIEAIKLYEEIIDGGWESGSVYYNLGNSYFKVGDVGRSVLNYERAKKISSRDSDLMFNYKYVAVTSLEGDKDEGIITRLLSRHVEFYSLSEMVMILTALIVVVILGFIVFSYFRWPFKYYIRGSIIIGVFVVVFIVGLILKIDSQRNAIILLSTVEAKFEPQENATTHYHLKAGEKATLMQVDKSWSKIKRLDGKLGWILNNSYEEI